MMRMKTLGIVGGIAPESTIEYYRLLIAGYRDRCADGSYPPLFINSIDVNKVLALAARADREELMGYLVASLIPLAHAGADFALIASNTPHIVFPEIAKKSPLPLISIVEATRDFATARKFKKLGLFGTRSTMQGGFYQKAFLERGMKIILPTVQEQDYIHEKYVGELVAGRFLPEIREQFIFIISRLRDEGQIDGLILGGTELPLLLRDDTAIGIPLLNTALIHVQAALDRMFS
jgi:aspartate racemase